MLSEIIKRKKGKLRSMKRKGKDFFEALKNKGFFLIGEIKIASPSTGLIKESLDISFQTRAYEEGGASAISVVTEENFFRGNLDLLREVRRNTILPLLRKDFVIDPVQIYESFLHGTDILLLISSLLPTGKLRSFIKLCEKLGILPLVEIHSIEDAEKAYRAGAYFIGINNRNLETLEVSIEHTLKVLPCIKELFNDRNAIIISESGISSPEHTKLLKDHGINGVLVGLSLLKTHDPARKVRELLLMEELSP